MFKRIAVILDPTLECQAIFSACKLLGKGGEVAMLAVPCAFNQKRVTNDSGSQQNLAPDAVFARKIRDFVRICATAKIDYEIASSTPLQLREAMATIQGTDFVLLARPAEKYASGKLFEKNLRRLFMHCGCPILVAAPTTAPLKTIIVAWDGSPEAVRTMKMHVQLFQAFRLHYVFIMCGEDAVTTETQLHTAADYISHHSLSAETLALTGQPSAVLTTAYRRFKADQMLIGLHRRQVYKKKKFGKTSRTLLAEKSITLFLFD